MRLNCSNLVPLAFNNFAASNLDIHQLVAGGMSETEACCCFFSAIALMENSLSYLTALEYKESFIPDVAPFIQTETVKYFKEKMPNIAFHLSALIPSQLEQDVVKTHFAHKGRSTMIDIYPTLLECYRLLQEPRLVIFSTAIVKNQMAAKPRLNRFIFQEPFLLWSFGLTGSEPATEETVKKYTLASSVVGIVCQASASACAEFFGRPAKTQWA